MSHELLRASDAHWRESNQMRVANTDLAGQLGAAALGARLWRLRPGQASTRHRHEVQEELYLLLEGEGRIRIGTGEPLTLQPGDALRVSPEEIRQVFNDGSDEATWLVVGAPREEANTTEMSAARLRSLYPDGPRALPPELGGGSFDPGEDGKG